MNAIPDAVLYAYVLFAITAVVAVTTFGIAIWDEIRFKGAVPANYRFGWQFATVSLVILDLYTALIIFGRP